MRQDPDIYTVQMYPNQSQEARMLEIMHACYETYCWTIDGLLSGRYQITPETLYDVIDKQMKPDWIDQRPKKICPWTTMRYMIREACNNWLDQIDFPDKEAMATGLKAEHFNKLYIPYSGMKLLNDTVQIERVCRVKIDHVEIPTRLYLVIAYPGAKHTWWANIRAAKPE